MKRQRGHNRKTRFTVYSITVGGEDYYDMTSVPNELQRYYRKQYLDGAVGWPYDDWRAAEHKKYDIIVKWLVWPLESYETARAIAAYLTLGKFRGYSQEELLNDIDDWRRSQEAGDNG